MVLKLEHPEGLLKVHLLPRFLVQTSGMGPKDLHSSYFPSDAKAVVGPGKIDTLSAIVLTTLRKFVSFKPLPD